ncbi:uncharacterized protein FYW47_003390 [Aplochiton taeniatus]
MMTKSATHSRYPVHNPVLLEQWLKMIDRPSWVPRPMSAICSKHFTEDSFVRTGDTVTLKPDAVPGLFLFKNPFTHHPAGSTLTMPILEEVTTQDQSFFAKYDAVDRYLRKGIYPPGINYVEKNTIRRFCKNYIIKDELLHWVKGTKVRQVLRSREEVNTALTDFHDELNHLDLKKCMRLLNERFFWSTMRADVARWIDKCSECSKTKMTEPPSIKAMETTKPMEPMKPLQIIDHPFCSRVSTPEPQPQSESSTPESQPQNEGSTSQPKPSPQSKRKKGEPATSKGAKPVVTESKKPCLVFLVSKQTIAQASSPVVERYF